MPGPTQIVDLAADVKPYLNIQAADASNDAKLNTFISGATFWANRWFGNVVQSTYTEQHDGGDTTIQLREAPIALDAGGVPQVTKVTEIIGGVIWTLTLQPVGQWVDQFGYSVDFPDQGIITRRTLNSHDYPFAEGNGNITVTYVSGRLTVPGDIKLAVLEDIRGLFQQTQLGGHPQFGGAGGDEWTAGPVHLFPRLAALSDSALRLPAIG